MKIIKKISFIALLNIIVIILCNYAFAQEYSIQIEISPKPIYYTGEVIQFEYSLLSNHDLEIIYNVGIKCENEHNSFYVAETVNLEANTLFSDRFDAYFVDSTIESQNCTAYVQVTSPTWLIKEKNFTIKTEPLFIFELLTCKDSLCSEKSKIFIKNEDIYLDYDSEVPEPTITAILTLPDKTTQQLTLPTSIKAEQIGTYILDITASKPGYKTITKKEQFGVVEHEAEIPFVGVCNANNKCEKGETNQNCPQDCKPGEIPKKPIFIYLISIILILILISIIIYFRIIKRKYETTQ